MLQSTDPIGMETLEPRLLLSGKADLVLGGMAGIDGSPIVLGTTVSTTLFGWVYNDSTAAAGGSRVGVYLSKDAKVSADDVALSPLAPSRLRIPALAPQTHSDCHTQMALPASLPAGWADGQYYLIAKVDADNKVAESNESNNILAVKVPVSSVAKPELTAWVMANYDGVWGGTLHTTVMPNNNGAAAAGAFWTDVYLSQTPTITASSVRLTPTAPFALLYGGLAAGANGLRDVELNLPAARPAGWTGNKFYLVPSVDSTHTVAEVVETNNRRDSRGENSVVVTATAKPDLVTTISQYDHADRWNDSAKVILYVNNPGSLAVGPNRTRLFLSRDAKLSADDVPLKVLVGSTSMKYFYISHMKAGGTVAEEVTVKLPAKPAGWQGLDYYVIAMADSPKTVAELNEANNVSSGKMNIQPWRPDLTPGLMGVPATGHWGGTVALQFSAMNVGGGACRSFNVRFSLTDPSGAKTAPLNLVGGKTTCWYPALAYQANSPTKTVTIRLPAVRPAGLAGRRFRILIQLDPSNRINEVDETNNSAWTDLITVT